LLAPYRSTIMAGMKVARHGADATRTRILDVAERPLLLAQLKGRAAGMPAGGARTSSRVPVAARRARARRAARKDLKQAALCTG
jgi:hypothetical protein